MKKVALLCAVAICLAACHCERRTTGTPCRKASCQAANVASQNAQKEAASKQTTSQKTAAEKKAATEKKTTAEKKAAVEKKAAEQASALNSVGNATYEGNMISLKFKEPIHFAYNSDKIAASSNKNLEATANILKKYPNNKVTVKGYTDSLGDPLYNIDLSQRRAQAVANALVERGVKAENVSAIGFGSANPIATNKTSVGRAQNRRVELQIEVK
ncbi:MAG: OmpA family protein [Elusimicrobiaceae bacterium]|nr:OmpA family protein [Elusimicrobiaceae bacterium]